MKARQADGRPWFDNRFEQETKTWLIEMAFERMPLSKIRLLQNVAAYALARYMAWKDGEVDTF